jgi:carboxymethylenebutenolidase
MRRSSLVFLSLLLTASALAQHDHGGAQATITTSVPMPAHGKNVTFGEAMGYLSVPDSKGPHPAIIVIQEWWGLNDWVRQQADRFARDGYVALAVDLYRGKVATDQELAHELSRGLPEDRAISDLKAGVDYLVKRSDVNARKVGVIGWCMGGGFSLGLSLADPRIAATVINYGHLVTDPATIARIHAPILGNFGGNDRGIPPADVRAFEAALVKAGKKADLKIYDGAGHAFMNANNAAGYVPAAAKDANARVDAFLARTLR